MGEDWRIGGLEDWRIGGLEDWRIRWFEKECKEKNFLHK
jgi:hypothetical protein